MCAQNIYITKKKKTNDSQYTKEKYSFCKKKKENRLPNK